MIEYAKYGLNIRKMSMNNIKSEKKIDTLLRVLSILIMLFFFIFLNFLENPVLWVNILGLFFACIIPLVKKLFKRKKILFSGEIDLEVKRDNFYFYKDGEMKLELLYKDTDVKYKKTLIKDIKMIMYNCEEMYCFYIKKDHDTSGYDKLYSDLEATDYHEKIPVLKEVIFNIVVLGIIAAGILIR